ncbi:uL13 family ribosomal protein, partial [Candidatus Dojkabacteria bacterium]|nr:uL13 family ribosomal protein [Candidatus Dojkabacteria bacterium]
MTKTRSIKKSEINPEWHILDATGVRLGKLATKAASLLIGKHKTNKADNMPSGDKVVIINSKLVDVHKRKLTGKKYYSHSGYIGGLKELDLEEMMK